MRFWNWLNDRIVVCAWGIAAAILTVGLLVAICRLGFVHVVTGKWVTSAGALRDVALTLAAVIGFPIVIQRARSHDKQAKAAKEQAEANRKQAETDSHRRLAEAYSQAATLFAKRELPLRLSGLYALWKIAEEDPENHHVQIMQILCAFVRHPTPLDGWKQPPERKWKPGDDKVAWRPDMKALLTLIGERSERQIVQEMAVGYRSDLRDADLVGTNFVNADLRHISFVGADLRGVNFTNADLRDVRFIDVMISDTTRFFNAALNGAIFDSHVQELQNIRRGVIIEMDTKTRVSNYIKAYNDNNLYPLPSTPFLGTADDPKWLDELPRMEEKRWQRNRKILR